MTEREAYRLLEWLHLNIRIILYFYNPMLCDQTLPGFVVAAAEVPFLPIDVDVLASVGPGPGTGGLGFTKM